MQINPNYEAWKKKCDGTERFCDEQNQSIKQIAYIEYSFF